MSTDLPGLGRARGPALDAVVAGLVRSVAALLNATRTVGNPVDLTGQTAAIGTTNLIQFAKGGPHRMTALLEITTAGGADRTVTVTLGWTDRVGATTLAPGTLNAASGAGTGRFRERLEVYASGDTALTYATSVAGVLGSAPVYALTVRTERMV